jgi:RNA polymerase sigma-70 factor, ECF subfamily
MMMGRPEGASRMAAASGDHDKADRFRQVALPYLDDVYTLARYLLRNAVDADDAVQECYLRAFRYFDTFRGGAIKPWLLAILRNVCRAEQVRRAGVVVGIAADDDRAEEATREEAWREPAEAADAAIERELDAATIRRLLDELPAAFREVMVLREVNDLSYREIAEVVGSPIGTVMSRLARGRALLRAAWVAAEKDETKS